MRRRGRAEAAAIVIKVFRKVSPRRYLRKDLRDVRDEPYGEPRKSVWKGRRECPGLTWCVHRKQGGQAEGWLKESARSLSMRLGHFRLRIWLLF